MFIKAAMPRDKRNQNSELFFRQSPEVFGCLQLWVFNSKFGRSNGVVVGLHTARPEFESRVSRGPFQKVYHWIDNPVL
jgi:hypothetical protein